MRLFETVSLRQLFFADQHLSNADDLARLIVHICIIITPVLVVLCDPHVRVKIFQMNNEKWLSDRQAQHYLGVSRTTLYRYRTEGLIRYFQVGKLLRYRLEDLDAFLLNYEIEHNEEIYL